MGVRKLITMGCSMDIPKFYEMMQLKKSCGTGLRLLTLLRCLKASDWCECLMVEEVEVDCGWFEKI